jgi:alternate signal-mediated exported protein
MNKKILGSVAALVAVLALVAGGTFAAWSDFVTLADNGAGAETLTLSVNDAQSGSTAVPQTNLSLAPGTERYIENEVVSRSGDNTLANLYLTLEDLNGHENGCDGNSEIVVDGDCNDTNTAGEFITEAQYFVRTSDPIDEAASCAGLLEGRIAGLPGSSGGVFKLDVAEDEKVLLHDAGDPVGPGEKVCVQIQISLPFANATNASQGDFSDFDLTYDLEQVAGTP